VLEGAGKPIDLDLKSMSYTELTDKNATKERE
ncbi:unnamed protein product, partial [marine sediment metagenome]